jgi:hypothetical protein
MRNLAAPRGEDAGLIFDQQVRYLAVAQGI